MNIEMFGTPFNGLRDHMGIESPPNGLRRLGIVNALRKTGHTVADLGDLEGFHCQDIRDEETGINDFGLWLDLTQDLSRTVGSVLDRNSFPLVLGGDCRLLVGVMKALIQKKTNAGLVFLDGHADFHTAKTSPSGDPADMELAVMTGRGPDAITHIAGKYPILEDRDVVVYGIRARDHIDESQIKIYDRNLLTRIGVRRGVKEGMKN
jgi:arginase